MREILRRNIEIFDVFLAASEKAVLLFERFATGKAPIGVFALSNADTFKETDMIEAVNKSVRGAAAPLVQLLAALLVIVSLQAPAQAAMVSTQAVIAAHDSRSKVAEYLQRDAVREALMAQGVDADAALLRVERLTDAEVAMLADRIDELPAGGDIVGAALLVFFVLLATDILGYTHVFPFVNR